MANKRLVKRFVIVIIILLVIFGGLFGFGFIRNIMIAKFMAHFKMPAPVVSDARATTKPIQAYLSTVGSLQAEQGAELSTQAAGNIIGIFFKSGQQVRKGQLLFQLDDSVDQQTLRSDMAKLQLAKINYLRQLKLKVTSATSTSALDTAAADYKQALATVSMLKAQIAQKQITAPFAGVVGIRQVNLGQYVAPGTALVSLDEPRKLYANFSLPEQQLSRIKLGQKVLVTADSAPGVQLAGTITAIDSNISDSTRNINIQATVANPKQQLYPGSYAYLKIITSKPVVHVLVPNTAVSYSLYGDAVYTLTPIKAAKDSKTQMYKATENFVTVGEQQGGDVEILKGVNAGQLVVTSGQNKLYPGVQVSINNSVNLQKNLPNNKYT